MRGAWYIARFAGIEFYVHWSFSLVVLWMILQGAIGGRSLAAIIFISVALLLLFGCVALHEFGHALMALRFKVVVKSITLLPFGGFAQIQTVPQKPLYELVIAAAGPLVNLGIAAGLALLLLVVDAKLLVGFIGSPRLMTEAIFLQAPFWQSPVLGLLIFLIFANSVLFIFNLIPTFPLDGGRILRALLAMVLPYRRATQLAIGLGQLTATFLLFYALRIKSFALLFIAIFVLVASLPLLMRRDE